MNTYLKKYFAAKSYFHFYFIKIIIITLKLIIRIIYVIGDKKRINV